MLPETAWSLSVIVLLSTAGGMLDGIFYLLHGHVFANAMAGNLVLLGLSLAAGNTAQALSAMVPLAGFTLGVFLAEYLLQHHRALSLWFALLFEMAGLVIAGALPPHFPRHLLVGFVALTAALQITAFRRLRNIDRNTTFITANLSAAMTALFDFLFPVGVDADARRQTRTDGAYALRDLGLISLGFLTGAMLGARCAGRFADRSFWLADLLLLAACLLLRGMPASQRRGPQV